MRRIILFVLCFINLQSITYGLRITKPEAIPFLGLEEIVSDIKMTVFAIQVDMSSDEDKNEQWKPLGTGFFVKSNEPNAFLGITCEHIVTTAEGAKKPMFIGLSTEKGYHHFKCKVLFKDKKTDIAVLAFLNDPNEQVTLQYDTIKFFNTKSFGDANSLADGRGVIIEGFPLGLGVEADIEYPVTRIGIIAQNTKRNIFLIDGVANHGNSGSPVVAVKYGNYQLLGMITSYKNDFITLYDENHKAVALLPYNAGLAQAITAKEILKCISNAKLQ